MRPRRTSPEHQAAVSRRLAQLGAELSLARPASDPADEDPDAGDPDWWSEHTPIAPATRFAATDPMPDTDVSDGLGPGARNAAPVPLPGRHASRRGGWWGGLVPETLRGRAALGPGPVAAVAVVVTVGLAVTCWWLVRSDPEQQVGQPVGQQIGQLAVASAGQPLATPAAATGASPVPTPSGGPTGTLVVDVAGKVRRPGIAVLPAGSRVVDALEAAGGARRGVDLAGLNLARVLVDGEQVLVGEEPATLPVQAAPGTGTGSAGAVGAPVDLNRASQAELELLPEIGPVTAAAIIAWREEHGGFRAVQELLEVSGIGEATLAAVTPHVTV